MRIILCWLGDLIRITDIAKKIKNTTQDAEAKIKTEEEHAEGKPSSETLNKAKVKVRDALT
ncbi:MAG TPA: hypothetical protein VJR67_00775 [Candidatus Nitrosopolaris sp.]|nr:hypothetical protein [Candidatus Nitrosopolaris sp.]